VIPLPVIWLLVGTILVMIEFVTMGATAFIAEAAGFMAFIIALISVFVPQVSLQVGLWLILSALAVWYSRRLVPQHNLLLMEAQEGHTLTPISGGNAGRVKFEGQSWRAICQDPNISIEAGVEVIVLEKMGNTLVVVPKNWLKTDITGGTN
jgi:membrane protein implicated in regulation of membrane protease activity